MLDIGLILTAYLLCGISTGYYLVRHIQQQDIRNYGSRATGATNVGRVLGKKGFVLTGAGDLLKGSIIPGVAVYLGLSEITIILSLVAGVVGNIWPLQLGFRGGKGVATAFGGLVVVDPVLAGILFTATMGLFAITRKFSFSGYLVITASPIIVILLGRPILEVWGVIGMAIIMFIAHRENLRKLLHQNQK
ncbi:MAG TPA: glycerol-3-phosphate acyltransferase [Verrucomicrobiae bacterium]|nr:glycerol-3-phosphate acyltransferase [Verrucomicrobiae bacterium]